jgi:hypothetical protein
LDKRLSKRRLNYDSEIVNAILTGKPESLRFLSYFWSYTPNERDIDHFNKFCRFVRMYSQRVGLREIARTLGVDRDTIADWRDGRVKPVLMNIYLANRLLGRPRRNHQWLPLKIANYGHRLDHWIQVPMQVRGGKDVKDLISQLKGLPTMFERAQQLRVAAGEINRLAMFGFLLGVMLGDAGKQHSLHVKSSHSHRLPSLNLTLELTMHFKYNIRFGEYTALCCNSLGLKMIRAADCSAKPQERLSKWGTYSWRSERSPLLAWIFNRCLGLNFDETTTGVPVRMDWILKTPRAFRIAFLQGLAESDGNIEYAGYVRIISWPNVDFVIKLLKSVGVKGVTTRHKGMVSVVAMTIDRAHGIGIFNRHVNSKKYQRLEKMGNAKRFRRIWPDDVKNDIHNLSSEMNAPAITVYILEKYNVYIRPHSINRYLRRKSGTK